MNGGWSKDDREKIDREFWEAHKELAKTIEALNQATNPKTTVLANIMFKAQRERDSLINEGVGSEKAGGRSAISTCDSVKSQI